MNQIEAIEKRCNEATPGPWEEGFTYHGSQHCGAVRHNGRVVCETRYFDMGNSEPNAEFIAHAREDIPFLLNEVKRLTAELERPRTTLNGTYIDIGTYERLYAELEHTKNKMKVFAKETCDHCGNNTPETCKDCAKNIWGLKEGAADV